MQKLTEKIYTCTNKHVKDIITIEVQTENGKVKSQLPMHITEDVMTASFVVQTACHIVLNPFKLNGFFHPYYSEESILHFRGVRLIFFLH